VAVRWRFLNSKKSGR